MLNSKIINIFWDSMPERTIQYGQPDKLQIELNLDQTSRLVIEFEDELLSCGAGELDRERERVKASKEYQTYLKKFNRIKESYLMKKEQHETNNNSSSTSKKSNKRCVKSKSSSNSLASLNFIEASREELLATVSSLVGCIGCRVAVERFYNQLIKNRDIISKINETIYPILIDDSENLTLNSNLFLVDPFRLYSIFYLSTCLPKTEIKQTNTIVSSVFSSSTTPSGAVINANLVITANSPKPATNTTTTNNNKNRRCQLHSLDKSKSKSMNDWLPVWHALANDDCRSKFILVDVTGLTLVLHGYLRRFKFCSECRQKVLRAFSILIGEVDPNEERAYCASIYDGIECCSAVCDCDTNCEKGKPGQKHHLAGKHLHLTNNKDFIGNLIYKAELDINGSHRERHAKSIDIAQQEVITCIGIYLFEKFHRVLQLIKQEEQTWQLLLHSSVLTLKKAFEMEFERLQGATNLELLCAELEAEEIIAKKKQAKKSKKSSKKKSVSVSESPTHQETDTCNQEEEEDEPASTESLSSPVEVEKKVNNQVEIHGRDLCDCNCSFCLSSFCLSYECSCKETTDEEDSSASMTSWSSSMQITDEEKNEYYANKARLLLERKKRRELLRQQFQNLKLSSNFRIRPRHSFTTIIEQNI